MFASVNTLSYIDEASNGLGWPQARWHPSATWSSDWPGEHQAPLFGEGAVAGQWGLGEWAWELRAAPSCSWGSERGLAVRMDALMHSGGAFPQIPAALASLSPAFPGLHCQQMLVGRLQPRPWLPMAPCSVFAQQAACGTWVAVPPPPPATTHEERLPAVTNPAESGRRLRCSQSPREIVPRAFPQPRGTGTRASLLGPPQPPGLGPAPQGLWQCLGGMESTPWTWPCEDPLAKGCPAAPEGCDQGSGCSPAGRQAWHPWVQPRRGELRLAEPRVGLTLVDVPWLACEPMAPGSCPRGGSLPWEQLGAAIPALIINHPYRVGGSRTHAGTVVPRLSKSWLGPCWKQRGLDLLTAAATALRLGRVLCLAVFPVPAIPSWAHLPKRPTRPSVHLWGG